MTSTVLVMNFQTSSADSLALVGLCYCCIESTRSWEYAGIKKFNDIVAFLQYRFFVTVKRNIFKQCKSFGSTVYL